MKPNVIPLSAEAVGLYLHVPFCTGKCRYCSFYSEPVGESDAERLISAMKAELARYRDVETVGTIYVGGGSPTSLPLDLLDGLLGAVASIWPGRREFTVECNPGQIDGRILATFSKHGVNRLSFGVQSFDAGELALLGRRHSPDRAVQAIEQARGFGFDNIGLDLIFAIPGSTLESWRRSLARAVALGVDHISAYSLSFERGTALFEARETGRIEAIDEEMDRMMYEWAIDDLAEAGLVQYEISNFACDGFQCLHNLGYWANRPYLGIGPAAGAYWDGRRTLNVPDIVRYIQRIEAGQPAFEDCQQPSATERVCETAVLNLRTRDGIDLQRFHATTGVEFAETFGAPLKRYERQGLIEVTDRRVRLTRKALAVADPILCDFSAF